MISDNLLPRARAEGMGAFLVLQDFLLMKSCHLCESAFISAEGKIALQCLMESHQMFWMDAGM